MPTYVYAYLDKDGNPTDERFEIFQSIKDDAFDKNPDNKRPCQRVICAPCIKHNGPAWEWCRETQKYINETKPKFIRDDNAGVRMRYPKDGV